MEIIRAYGQHKTEGSKNRMRGGRGGAPLLLLKMDVVSLIFKFPTQTEMTAPARASSAVSQRRNNEAVD